MQRLAFQIVNGILKLKDINTKLLTQEYEQTNGTEEVIQKQAQEQSF